MSQLLLNGVFTTLASGVTNVATSATVATGDGAKFSTASTANPIRCVVVDTSTTPETIKEYVDVTARSTDTLTISRAVEDATRFPAVAWTTGWYIAPVATAKTLLNNMTVANVIAYGAVGDGVTDDSAAIQAALDAVAGTVTTNSQSVNGTTTFVGPGTGGGVVYIPPGTYKIGTTLQVKSLTRLEGAGWTTLLVAANSLNAPVIKASGSKMAGVQVAHLRIDGNKANQTSGHGIQWQSAGVFTTYLSGTSHLVGCGAYLLDNVYVVNAKQDGVHIDAGVSELRCHAVISAASGRYGFGCDAMFDSDFDQCCVQGSESAGVSLVNGSAVNRFTNFKVYGAGNTDNAAAYDNAGQQHTFTNCEAQETVANGWWLRSTATKTIIRSCRATGIGGYGVFIDGTSNEVDIVAESGYSYTAIAAVGLGLSGVTGNNIRIQTPLTSAITGDATNNTVTVNDHDGVQAPTFASTLNIDPYAGGVVTVLLTGNITINTTRGHAGARLKFILGQDSTGGRTVTWGTGIKANWTPTTTAALTNVIEFVNDGTNWIQVATAVGIAGATPLLLDNFTRAASTTSMGSAETGQAWVPQGTPVWGLDGSSHSYAVTTGSNAITVIDVGTGDVDHTVVIATVASGEFPGGVIRFVDTSNYIYFQVNTSNGNIELAKNVAGTATTLGTYGAAVANGSSHTFRLTAKGSALTLYFDGVSRITATDSAGSTNTKVGQKAFNASAASRFDKVVTYAA